MCLVAEGVAAALGRFGSMSVISVTTDAQSLLEHPERLDAVAIDRYATGATVVARALRARGVRVVTLGESDDEGQACVSLHQGSAALVEELVPGLTARTGTGRLTAREREILALTSSGLSAKQVAGSLGIARKTVENHKAKIFAKLAVPNGAAAASAAALMGSAPSVSNLVRA